MSTTQLRRVAVEVFTSGDRHCSNDCPHMAGGAGSMSCELFSRELTWNKRRKYNGYQRAEECRKAEQ